MAGKIRVYDQEGAPYLFVYVSDAVDSQVCRIHISHFLKCAVYLDALQQPGRNVEKSPPEIARFVCQGGGHVAAGLLQSLVERFGKEVWVVPYGDEEEWGLDVELDDIAQRIRLFDSANARAAGQAPTAYLKDLLQS